MTGWRLGDFGHRDCEGEEFLVIAHGAGERATCQADGGAEGIAIFAGDAEDLELRIRVIGIDGDALIGSFFIHQGHAVTAIDG